MQVIPAHAPEQLKPIPNTRTRTFFIVKAQLDEIALRNAFDQLIRQHWRMLGARIVKNPKAGYEYHLPESFDDDYELFKWSSSKVDTSLEEALPWIEAPKSDGISLLPPVTEADRLFRPVSWPFELKDDPKDGPQFYIHLTFFNNATVLAISMPHLLADQLGLANLLKAWLGLAAGCDPPAYIHDAIPEDARYEDYSEEERYRKGWFRVRRRFERFLVILGFMPDFILKPTEQPSILFLPKSTIDQLRKRFAKELEAKYGQDPKVTNGDVLTAIVTKLSRFSDKKPQWVTLTQSMNARNRLPELSGDKMDGYIGSALFFGSSRFCLDPSTTRLSDIAYANRKAIEEALDPGLIRMQFAIHREMVKRGQPIHVCEPWEYSFSVTSWTSAWQGIDFGSVVQGGRTSEPPEFQVLGGSGERGVPSRFHTCIMGKAQGGYWMDFHSEIGNYNAIKSYLAQDPKLENL